MKNDLKSREKKMAPLSRVHEAGMEQLKASEESYRVLFERSRDGFVSIDADGRVITANQSFCGMLGYSLEELRAMDNLHCITPKQYHDWEREEIWNNQLLKQEYTSTYEKEYIRKDGSVFPVERQAFCVFYDHDNGKPAYAWAVVRDITERKKFEQSLQAANERLTTREEELQAINEELRAQEEELRIANKELSQSIARLRKSEQSFRESENHFRILAETADDAIITVTHEGAISYWNNSAERMFGYTADEAAGKPITLILPRRLHDIEIHGREKGFASGYNKVVGKAVENTGLRKSGEEFYVETSTSVVKRGDQFFASAIIRDITGRKRAEEERLKLELQLIQSQKMEAIGTLAGGIAHDFNNILAAIIGFTELAHMQSPAGSTVQQNLEQTLKSADRARSLVNQILSFSRKNLLERKPVMTHLIVKEAIKLLRASIPATIEIRHSVNEQAGMVMSDPTQIHQVIINLCTNAAHAMEGKSGVLGIDLSPVEISAEDIKTYPDLHPGDYVRLIVSDTGTGIDPAIADRIFDPFFTTKEKGKGTGMGLSIVHGIVKSYGGAIAVESAPGSGSTFRVFFPRMSGEAEEETEDAKPLPRGTERILFVDDEAALTELAKMMLEPLGYKVAAVQSSREALALFQKAPERFDLVITDLTMPHMSGYDLVQQLIKFRPGIPVILCTGYNEAALEGREKDKSIKAVLIKPFNRRVLAETIRKVLHKM